MTQSALPTNSLSRSHPRRIKQVKPLVAGASPIAADGGFGPMDEEESEAEEENFQIDHNYNDIRDNTSSQAEEGLGDDFDDFESGAENEDFGDFDEGFQQRAESDEELEETESLARPIQSIPQFTSPFVSIMKNMNKICLLSVLSRCRKRY